MNYTDNMTLQTYFMGGAFVFSVMNFALAALFWRLKGTFVSKEDAEKAARVQRANSVDEFEKVERRIGELDTRMRAVEANAAGAAAEIKGVHEGVARVERLTTLLVEFRFKEADAYGKA